MIERDREFLFSYKKQVYLFYLHSIVNLLGEVVTLYKCLTSIDLEVHSRYTYLINFCGTCKLMQTSDFQ